MTAHPSTPIARLRRTTLALCLAGALPAFAVGAAIARPFGDHGHVPFGKDRHAERAERALKDAMNVSRSAGSPAKNTHGVGIVVQNCDAAGAGSLRDAFANAQADDIIDLRSLECPNGEIRLTAASGGSIGTTISGLQIVGPGAAALTIHGDDTNPVFQTLFASLSISDLTIAHGRTTSGFGGCLFIDGDLTLTRSVVTGCRAGDGANAESFGGGVDVLGNLIMNESTIRDSTALASDGAAGGGAYVRGTATLLASTVSSNTARSTNLYAVGGGLVVQGDVSILGGSRLTLNAAHSEAGRSYGGAFITNGTTEIRNRSTISSNTSESANERSSGGAVAASGDIVIERSTIEGNTTRSSCANCLTRGGGVIGFGTIAVVDSSISNNSAQGASSVGGGLATYSPNESGAIVVTNSTISGNRAIGTQSGAGGGVIALYASPFTVTSSTIAFNEATTYGGGLAGSDTATIHPSIVNSIVAMNTAGAGADIDSAYTQNPFTIEGSNNIVISADHVDFAVAPSTADPKLMPLFNNGGATQTHALANCSPAINQGTPVKIANDQRGAPYVRAFGSAPDLGAFEAQPDVDIIFGTPFEILPDCD